MTDERRGAVRRGLHHCTRGLLVSLSRVGRVFLVDYSETGLRINNAVEVPSGIGQLRVMASNSPPRAFDVEKTWAEPLRGDSWVTGLRFVPPRNGGLADLLDLSEASQPNRRSFRLACVSLVWIGSNSGQEWRRGTAVDLSFEGLRLLTDQLLYPGQTLPVRLPLQGSRTIHCMGEVVWVRQMSNRCNEAGIHIVDMSPRAAKTLQRHLLTLLGQSA